MSDSDERADQERKILEQLSAVPIATDLIGQLASLKRAVESRRLENVGNSLDQMRYAQGNIAAFRWFETLTKRCLDAKGSERNK